MSYNRFEGKNYVTLCCRLSDRGYHRRNLWIHRDRRNVCLDSPRLVCPVSCPVYYLADL